MAKFSPDPAGAGPRHLCSEDSVSPRQNESRVAMDVSCPDGAQHPHVLPPFYYFFYFPIHLSHLFLLIPNFNFDLPAVAVWKIALSYIMVNPLLTLFILITKLGQILGGVSREEIVTIMLVMARQHKCWIFLC